MEQRGIPHVRLRPAVLTLLALAALAAAGCGEKKDTLGPEGSKRIELMLDYFPNADHAAHLRGPGGRALLAGRDQRGDPPAPGPRRAAEGAGRRPGGPGHLVRAGGAEGARPGAERGVRGSARPAPAHLDHLPAEGRDHGARKDLAGTTVGTAGIDYQTAYLRTILLDHGVNPSTVKERNVGFGLVPALLTGRVDATLGALLELRGRGAEAERAKAAHHPRGPGRGAHLRRAGARGQRGRPRARRRRPSGRSSAPSPGACAISRPIRTRRLDGLLKANRDLDPGLQRASLKATLPLFSPP